MIIACLSSLKIPWSTHFLFNQSFSPCHLGSGLENVNLLQILHRFKFRSDVSLTQEMVRSDQRQ